MGFNSVFKGLIITIRKAQEFELQEPHWRILDPWNISVEYRIRKWRSWGTCLWPGTGAVTNETPETCEIWYEDNMQGYVHTIYGMLFVGEIRYLFMCWVTLYVSRNAPANTSLSEARMPFIGLKFCIVYCTVSFIIRLTNMPTVRNLRFYPTSSTPAEHIFNHLFVAK